MNRKDKLVARFKELNKAIVGVSSLSKKKQIHVVAVTKYSPIEDIDISYSLGHKAFGENRVLDLQEKSDYFIDKGIEDIDWHFIGNLQSKKVNRLLKISGLRYIHSVDSLSLLETILKKEEQFRGEKLGLFLQINTSEEEEKSGFLNYDSVAGAVNLFLEATDSKFYLCGLMTMGKIRTDDQKRDARVSFQKLKAMKVQLEDDFGLDDLKLSMGMSSDFELAVEEGTDFIRVGSTLYSQ
jgi:pyridoxal phosphate enzyme (YggS family)